MKKKLLILSTLFLAAMSVLGQSQISNSDFENWTTAFNGTDSLIGWSSSNATVISPIISLYRDTAAQEGNYAAHLVTAPFGFVQYSTIGALVNGDATFTYAGGGGGANVEYSAGGGSPILSKPYALQGYYKAVSLTDGDYPLAKVLLSYYNVESGVRDTVSYSEFTFPSSEIFEPFTIVFEDLLPDVVPDSITTVFYSSNPVVVEQFNVWSDLYLDGLELLYDASTDIEEASENAQKIRIYPNPARGHVSIEYPTSDSAVEIFDRLGQKVLTIDLEGSQPHLIDISSLAMGLYYVCLQSSALRPVRLSIL